MGLVNRLFKRKTKLSFKEAGTYLMSTAIASVNPFIDISLPEIAEILNIDLKTYDEDVLRGETMIVCIWSAIKSLEGFDKRLILEIHKSFLSSFSNETMEQFKEIIPIRYEMYNKAWDEKAGGAQTILSLNILSVFFNDGELDSSLIDPFASNYVLQLVFKTMESVLNYKAKIQIIP
jgi:hypothetical protein